MKKYFTAGWQSFHRTLDATGMYRTVTLALSFLVVVSVACGVAGLVPYSGPEQLLSLAVVLTVGLISNIACATLWRVHANHESATITALIVFFLVIPASISALYQLWIIAGVTFMSILSKYVLAWRRQHVINPAAAGALGMTLVFFLINPPPGYFETSWWVGQPALLLPLVLAGSIVVHKVRKWYPVGAFLVVAAIVFLFEEWRFTGVPFEGFMRFFTSGPSLFLAFFMLTEPFTMPPTKRLQASYGALVGALSQTTLFIPIFKMTPELALAVGNVAFIPWKLKQKLFLVLEEKRMIAENTFEFIFKKPAHFTFKAGQYLEWMLPHKPADSRGERRYFTIASSPTETTVRLALKTPEKGSSYKRALAELDKGEAIIASQLAGDFLLPKNSTQKIGCIAGGIGVTPFRSHLQYMMDSGVRHDTVLYYCNNTRAEIAYQEQFDEAAAVMKYEVVHVLAKEEAEAPFEQGFVTAEMLKRRTPDYLDRHWYLSGPPGMVNAYSSLLTKMGVSRAYITEDFFPGLA